MADHGQVEYATATGNDLPEHEATYKNFVQLAFAGSCAVASIVIALAIVGTTAHWGIAVSLIIVAAIVCVHGLASGSRVPSGVMVLISLLALAYAASGGVPGH
jgi:hypothetical protein